MGLLEPAGSMDAWAADAAAAEASAYDAGGHQELEQEQSHPAHEQTGQHAQSVTPHDALEMDPAAFALGKRLGRGSFATVYLAIYRPAAVAESPARSSSGPIRDLSSLLPVAAALSRFSASAAATQLSPFEAELLPTEELPVTRSRSGSSGSSPPPQFAMPGRDVNINSLNSSNGESGGLGSGTGGSAAGAAAATATAAGVPAGKKVVVKRLDRLGREQQAEVRHEIEMMRQAGKHPSIVPFKGWFKDDEGVLCLVMGYCEGGTLAAVLKHKAVGGSSNNNGGAAAGGAAAGADAVSYFPEDVVMAWFVQLLMALDHLHQRRILHRDLKPDNIFLSKNQRVVKLGDLGIAKQLTSSVDLATTCLGTPFYMSPEVLTNRPYTYASDVWSLGCVLYEMATRRTAFEAKGMPQLMVKILRNAYTPLPSHVTRPFQQLVNCMLRADPDDRPTTADLLAMSYVKRHMAELLGAVVGPERAPSSGMVTDADVAAALKRMARNTLNTSRGRPESGPVFERKNSRRRSDSGAAASDSAGPSPGRATPPAVRPSRPSLSKASALPAPVVIAKAAKQWDSGAQYEQKLARQAEMRYKARAMEIRLQREQVRRIRKEQDPVARAREAELQQHLRGIRQAKEAAAEERKREEAAKWAELDSAEGEGLYGLDDDGLGEPLLEVEDGELEALVEQDEREDDGAEGSGRTTVRRVRTRVGPRPGSATAAEEEDDDVMTWEAAEMNVAGGDDGGDAAGGGGSGLDSDLLQPKSVADLSRVLENVWNSSNGRERARVLDGIFRMSLCDGGERVLGSLGPSEAASGAASVASSVNASPRVSLRQAEDGTLASPNTARDRAAGTSTRESLGSPMRRSMHSSGLVSHEAPLPGPPAKPDSASFAFMNIIEKMLGNTMERGGESSSSTGQATAAVGSSRNQSSPRAVSPRLPSLPAGSRYSSPAVLNNDPRGSSSSIARDGMSLKQQAATLAAGRASTSQLTPLRQSPRMPLQPVPEARALASGAAVAEPTPAELLAAGKPMMAAVAAAAAALAAEAPVTLAPVQAPSRRLPARQSSAHELLRPGGGGGGAGVGGDAMLPRVLPRRLVRASESQITYDAPISPLRRLDAAGAAEADAAAATAAPSSSSKPRPTRHASLQNLLSRIDNEYRRVSKSELVLPVPDALSPVSGLSKQNSSTQLLPGARQSPTPAWELTPLPGIPVQSLKAGRDMGP